MKSVLKLKSYFFPGFAYVTNNDFEGLEGGVRSITPPVECFKLQLHSQNDFNPEKREASVWVFLELEAKGRPDIPYSFQIECLGMFGLDLEYETEDPEQVIVINGASLLLSTARDHIFSCTAKGPYPPITIPAFDLRGFQKDPVVSKTGKTKMQSPAEPKIKAKTTKVSKRKKKKSAE